MQKIPNKMPMLFQLNQKVYKIQAVIGTNYLTLSLKLFFVELNTI